MENLPVYNIKLCNNFNTIEFFTSELDFDKIKEINEKFVAATSTVANTQVVENIANKSGKMASEKQMNLIHKLNLSTKESMTYEEANQLIRKSFAKKGE
ncbi:MAG: hypothetical protein KBT03_13035 [Bacteroidales bacterium]|nr:hypothetical protein [Candidatus Scybalousia scybalohippi]